MNSEKLPEGQKNPTETLDDEIELMDLLAVIWKWKILIAVGTLVCIVIAAIVNYSMHDVYEVWMVFRPGLVSITKDGNRKYIDTAENIKAKVETWVSNKQIIDDAHIATEGINLNKLKIKVGILKKSDYIKVSMEIENRELGLQIMNSIMNLIRSRHEDVVTFFQNEYDILIGKESASMNMVKKNTADITAEIMSKKNQIDNLKSRISEIDAEIKNTELNTDLLIKQKDQFNSNESAEDNLLLMVIYSIEIQQNASYLNSLRSMWTSLNERLINYTFNNSTAENEKRRLESEYGRLSEQIALLEYKKKIVQNIQIVQKPSVSNFPIKPKRKFNVILSAISGFFLLTVLTFLVEYFSRYRSSAAELPQT